MLFGVSRSTFEDVRPQNNFLEAKSLAIRNQGFAMMRVAGICLEVLVCFHGLHMHVSTYMYLVIFQVDPRVKEGNLIGQPQSCEFDGRMVTVKVIKEDS